MRPDELTFLIKTFERPRCCWRLIRSIESKYPGYRITVLDDSETPQDFSTADTTTIQTEHDIGLAEGRNRLIESVETPYFCMLDDDYVFNKTTDIEKLLRVLEYGPYELCFGTVSNEPVYKYLGNIVRRGRRIHIDKTVRWKRQGTDVWAEVDIAPNVYVGRRGTQLRYESRWKTGAEHIDKAIRLKRMGLRSAYVPSVSVGHKQDRPKKYRAMRRRGSSLNRRWRKEQKVSKIVVSDTPMPNVPPVVILTPGSTGSRLAVQFYQAQGYQSPPLNQYGECTELTKICERIASGGKPDITDFAGRLPPVWVLKDPRLVTVPGAFEHWKQFFVESEAMLVLNMRNKGDHAESLMKRWGTKANEAMRRRHAARRIFDHWEGRKAVLHYETLKQICGLWSPLE